MQGLDPAHGPAPADVIVALRERAHTLREMAEKAHVWYGPITQWDDAAIAKHLQVADGRAGAAGRAVAAGGNVKDWNVENMHKAIEDGGRRDRRRHGQGRAAAARGDDRHAGVAVDRSHRVSGRA